MPDPATQPVLVVDDEAAVREFVGLTLRLAGYVVSLEPDARHLADAIVRERPRLVIMDVNMPGPSGIEAVRQLRARGCQVPVIILTARHQNEDKLAAFDAGADDYLVKPFSARQLVARVAALLRRRARS